MKPRSLNPGQLQMPMLYPREGETIERTVHLPPKPDPDKVEREKLQLEIDQLGQAQKEIQNQIETLARRGIDLEQKERAARKRLRELSRPSRLGLA